jgi:hypothetical protein
MCAARLAASARLSPREQFGNLIKRQLDVAQSADGQRVAACSES